MKNLIKLIGASLALSIGVSLSSSACAQEFDRSVPRVFLKDGKKIEFLVEKFKTPPPLAVSDNLFDVTDPVNSLLSVFSAMKRGDLKVFKKLNTEERVRGIEKRLDSAGVDISALPAIWVKSFEYSLFLTHKITYRDFVILVVQRAKRGGKLPEIETEISLSAAQLFVFSKIKNEWLLVEIADDNPVICCWYTRDGKPQLNMKAN